MANLDCGIARIPLQKGGYVHREFLCLSHVVLHSRIVGDIFRLNLRGGALLADDADAMLSSFNP
jgi:hypothetical protein